MLERDVSSSSGGEYGDGRGVAIWTVIFGRVVGLLVLNLELRRKVDRQWESYAFWTGLFVASGQCLFLTDQIHSLALKISLIYVSLQS